MIWSINFWFGFVIVLYCAFNVDTMGLNKLVYWMGLAICNFIWATQVNKKDK